MDLRRTLLHLLTFAVLAPAAGAQPVIEGRQELALDRPESWAMSYMTAATLFHGLGNDSDLKPWDMAFTMELAHIPRIDEEDTAVGFNGSKLEDLNKSPVFGRGRLGIGLPGSFLLELAYTPPISIDGARPDGFYGAALGRSLWRGDRWRAGARLFAQSGRVRGDITCSRATVAAGDDLTLNPFGCEAPSDDEAELDYVGLELNVAYRAGRWEPFAAWSYTRVRPEVQVNARTFGVIDRTRLVTSGVLRSGSAGLAFQSHPNLRFSFAVDYTPLDVVRGPGATAESDDYLSARLTATWRPGFLNRSD
ncbi:MAG: hypothetical protein AAGA23_03640 [Pseudomonadota bacterium]